MQKDIALFKEELPPTHDKFHAVIRGNLFIFFDKNSSHLSRGCIDVIHGKVTQFLVRAVRALGPDNYNLSVLGMASASGTHNYNGDLAGARAMNAAMCAIRQFELLQKADPTLKGSTITPFTTQLGDDLSRVDARIFHLKPGQIDKQQGIFRSAVFKFAAGRLEDHLDRPPSFVCSGAEAIRRAHELLANTETPMAPYPTQWGALAIKQGDVWGPTHRLVVSADWQRIVYLENDTLWSVPTPDFAREILLDGIIDGMQRAQPMARLAKIVMSFVQGLLVGPLEAAAAHLIDLFIWAGAHPDEVDKAMNAWGPAVRVLKFINDRCPTLWGKLLDEIWRQTKGELKDALVETVAKPENIAFFLGRVLHGLGGLDTLFYGKESPGKTLVTVSFGKILVVTVKCAALVTLLHLPEGLGGVTKEKIAELARSLQRDFAAEEKIKIMLSDSEADKIAEELLAPGVKAEFERMRQPLDDLEKALNKFVQDMESIK